METIAQRIMKVVEVNNVSKSEFARKINVTPAYISKLGKNPDSVPSDRTIYDICREYDINEEWLRTGKGEMQIPLTRSDTIAKFAGELIKEEDDSFKKKLINVLAKLDENQWEVLEDIAKMLTEKD